MERPILKETNMAPIKITSILSDLWETREADICAWFEEQYKRTKPLFYSSVDLRHSGHKLVPVDTNLFPAGFNLISETARKRASTQVNAYIKTHHESAKKVLLIPENHTRNTNYLENIYALQQIILDAGFECVIGGLAIDEPTELETAGGHSLQLSPLRRDDYSVYADEFEPDIVLVNNDMSAGFPEILHEIRQPIFPPIGLGWYQRRKTQHFDSYDEVATKFANAFDLDKWLISAFYSKCGQINFKDKAGLECVALNVEKTLSRIQRKYDEYGINDAPYVFIKADSGTYGMGIMTATSPEDVLEVNKKARKKMTSIKEGVENTQVIIQEGIPTIDTIEGAPAEPMVYLVNGQPISCFFRVNEARDAKGNLNARGMSFEPGEKLDNQEHYAARSFCPIQGLVARLATLAASRECYEDSWVI